MTFILSEDKALRKKLQGMTVTDQRADGDGVARQVGVWFGQPDQEIRSQSYPYVTIDMIDVVRDTDREYRAKVTPEYMAGPTLGANQNWQIDTPIPVSIDYQITTYSRQPRHDRQIMAQLLGNKLPIRFGILQVLENESVVGITTTESYTVRRLDVTSISKRDLTEQAKRLFINAISVRVSSEIPLEVFEQLYTVSQVSLDDPTRIRDSFIGVGSFTTTTPSVTP
jgi:hypothetical protein